MRRIWDTLGVIVITAFVLNALLQMIKPYVPWLLLGAVVVFTGKYLYHNSRNW